MTESGTAAVDLANFLRSRRHRVTPAVVGLPGGGRRRTPGLRREEVAARANISVTYYTFLEQGRELRPSTQVVSALAQALLLTAPETDHLHVLAGSSAPPRSDGVQQVHPVTATMVSQLDPYPAYVTSRCWDVLAANRAARLLWTDWDALPAAERNMVLFVFTDPQAPKTMPDWESEARKMLGRFRATSAHYPDDPRFAEITDRIVRESPLAARLWDDIDIEPVGPGVKRLWHAATGEFACPHAVHLLADSPDVKLVTFAPPPPVLQILGELLGE